MARLSSAGYAAAVAIESRAAFQFQASNSSSRLTGVRPATHGCLTGKPGVCIATLGPGALNFSTGAAYAHLGAMPMIMLTGQKPIMTARQARFQIVDVIASMNADQDDAPDRQRSLHPGDRP